MNRRAALLSIGSAALAGCASTGPDAIAPSFGVFSKPPQDGRIVLEVHFHTPEEAREICRRLSRRPETGAPACVTDRFTPGVEHIHIARPRDWQDWPVLIQLGHEVLHALKAEHR